VLLGVSLLGLALSGPLAAFYQQGRWPLAAGTLQQHVGSTRIDLHPPTGRVTIYQPGHWPHTIQLGVKQPTFEDPFTFASEAPPTDDLTGDGVPEVLLRSFTHAGSHATGERLVLINLDSPPTIILDQHDTYRSAETRWQDLDGDGRFELVQSEQASCQEQEVGMASIWQYDPQTRTYAYASPQFPAYYEPMIRGATRAISETQAFLNVCLVNDLILLYLYQGRAEAGWQVWTRLLDQLEQQGALTAEDRQRRFDPATFRADVENSFKY
jgi:hypothetical protein